MEWDDLRYFLAVHRAGSHKGAARALTVDPTTVGRRIAALEAALQTRVFARTPERLETTPAGRALLPRAERVELEVLAAEREALGSEGGMRGALRVTAGDAVVHDALLPALGELLASNPGLTVELRGEVGLVDLSRREADVALRLVRPREPSLIARRLGGLGFALAASDAYLQRRGTPRSFAALASHDFIGYDASLDRMPQVRWLHARVRSPRYLLRSNTTTTQVLACVEGIGVALLPSLSVARQPRLRALFPRQPPPARELFAVLHADLRGSPRVTAFLGWLARIIAPHLQT